MISCTSPPDEKLPPFDARTTALMSSAAASARNVSRNSAYDSKVSGFFRSGRGQRDDGDTTVDAPVEVRRSSHLLTLRRRPPRSQHSVFRLAGLG